MTNSEKFKSIFGIYAEEFWAYQKDKMYEWLRRDVPDTNDSDTISRRAAIDILKYCPTEPEDDYDYGFVDGLIQAAHRIKNMPSAQPEIVRCTDCKSHGLCALEHEVLRESDDIEFSASGVKGGE